MVDVGGGVNEHTPTPAWRRPRLHSSGRTDPQLSILGVRAGSLKRHENELCMAVGNGGIRKTEKPSPDSREGEAVRHQVPQAPTRAETEISASG